MSTQNINDVQSFSLIYSFFNDTHETEIKMMVNGEYAAIKDINARDFDTEDDYEFDAYYDKLDDWNIRHRWHPASGGSILADLYFQLIEENIEISWNNQEPEEGVKFRYKLGGVKVEKEQFIEEVNLFLKAYANQWF